MANVDAVSLFVQVARSQSFTAAAQALNVPLSTVSRKVSELENHLSAQLIDRSKRQIRLTEAGLRYFELCRKGLDALEYADRVMFDRHSDTAGTVTITVPPNLVEVLFLNCIDRFQQQYPKAKLRVLVSERLLDFVDDGVDLSFRVAPSESPDLVVRTLMRYRHRIVAAPSYAAMHALPESPAKLVAHKCIAFGFNSERCVKWTLHKASHVEDSVFEPSLSINDYAAVRAAVTMGQGIGELPEPLCNNSLRDGKLVEVLADWRLAEIKLYAVHAGKRSLPKLARLFLDMCAEEIGGRR